MYNSKINLLEYCGEKKYHLLIPYLKHCLFHIIPTKTEVSVSMGSDKTVPDPYSFSVRNGWLQKSYISIKFDFKKNNAELKFFKSYQCNKVNQDIKILDFVHVIKRAYCISPFFTKFTEIHN